MGLEAADERLQKPDKATYKPGTVQDEPGVQKQVRDGTGQKARQ